MYSLPSRRTSPFSLAAAILPYDFDDDDDDELYEITCPTCGDTILLDEGMIEEGSMNCPNCNELLEFDYDDLTIEDFEDKDEAPEKK